eukprot:maker-scaffold4328_size6153-snap-gene-0.6 protein:Tk12192 transcript:maker-scaffold4328_size6153-snap-gene-0.6-mRNA-1 annotation:"atp synthase subunit alpha"
MLIDWFTVGAQLLNFLILVWLMKRYLYHPVLSAIDAREKRIAAQIADAEAKETVATKERDDFQHKNDKFEEQRADLLAKATDEAKAEHQRLMETARKAADAMSSKREKSLQSEARNLRQAISQRTQQEVFVIVRKTLGDLATTDLEGRMVEVFAHRLRELDGSAKEKLASAIETSSEPAVVRSAFELPPEERFMSSPPDSLEDIFDNTFAAIGKACEQFAPRLQLHEMGVITNVSTGIAKVSGLPGVGFDELLKFPGDVYGIAFNLDEDEIGVVLLGDYVDLHAGDEVERIGRVMDVAVGDELLGRMIDPLGRPLDGNGPLSTKDRLPIERPAVAIMDRAPVTVPLQTGLKVVDALIPIGRGQRELIVGDRQTGKTAIALDTILNQKGKDVLCVYCAIGQRASAVAKGVATLRKEAYRELSLLLRRPPGREAFPGDIFYIHSRLLERATHLCDERGGGSLTALPIIETEAQNISAYIPTNLISITDGQIYLSPSLFELGVLPAVDVGKSVSRVGGKAQRSTYRAVAGDLKLAYAQFEELETFARFGARLDADTRKTIEHGRRIRACLKQPEFSPVAVPAQITVLLALTANLFDPVPLDNMIKAEQAVQAAATKIPEEVCARFETADKLSDDDRKAIIEIARQALTPFQSAKS